MKTARRVFLALVLMVTIHTSGHAMETEGLACKGGDVIIGDTMALVESKCGQPSDSSQNKQPKIGFDRGHNRIRTLGTTMVDNWTFMLDSSGLKYRVIFENGKVVRIIRIDYGK